MNLVEPSAVTETEQTTLRAWPDGWTPRNEWLSTVPPFQGLTAVSGSLQRGSEKKLNPRDKLAQSPHPVDRVRIQSNRSGKPLKEAMQTL